ncbi:MAG TPA: DNA recombination protein RmuC [Vicinamibacteria bacterium]
MDWTLAVIGIAAFVAAVAVVSVLLRRPDASAGLAQLHGELSRLTRAQDELRTEMQRSREASLLQLAEAAQGIRGEIGHAQRALAEVKALEHGRARQMEQAADSLRRLEVVVAGSSTRGAAGENILARALRQLPPDLLDVNVDFGSKIVEYALRLPGGRVLPIDSKWTSVASLERLEGVEDPQDRRRLCEQIGRELRARIRDMGKYLDPERTLSLGLLAVPDSVCAAAPEAQGEAYREGVLVVPYSLALPYVLALYRLTIRFGGAVDTDQLAARVRGLDEDLRKASEELEGRLSRALVQLENSRAALRDHINDARHATERLLPTAESEALPPRRPAELPVLAVGQLD